MTNSWDDMRTAKEESYFERKNREALERLAKKQAETAPLTSPVSGQPMKQEVFHGVVIDRCPVSGGVWLDAGELEQLMESAVKEAEHGHGLVGFFKGTGRREVSCDPGYATQETAVTSVQTRRKPGSKLRPATIRPRTIRPKIMTTVASKELETFPNPNPERDYEILFNCPEFSCLCPKTGQPDFATFDISYVPDKLCVELKSLKLYFWSFRDEGHFHEAVTNRILDDLVKLLAPRQIEVLGDFNIRGGIHTKVRVSHCK